MITKEMLLLAHVQALIFGGMFLIIVLLFYIAFYKDRPKKKD